MADRIETFIESTRLVRNTKQLKSLFMREILKEGYENAVYASTINRRLDYIAWNEFPSGYLDAYREFRWDKIDPVLAHIQVAKRPFRWPDVVSRLDLTRKQYAFLHECREIGVRTGVHVPTARTGQPRRSDEPQPAQRARGAAPSVAIPLRADGPVLAAARRAHGKTRSKVIRDPSSDQA